MTDKTTISKFFCSVYNIKRRMAILPPVAFDIFEAQVAPADTRLGDRASDDTSARKGDVDQIADPQEEQEDAFVSQVIPSNACLFCGTLSSTTLEHNVEHMLSEHGLFIPEPEHLIDLETFIGYLGAVISQYHECLYCGLTRSSLEGIRQHMKDKGHCMIDLTREPDLLEFWEFSDSAESEDETSTQDVTSKNRTMDSKNVELHRMSDTKIRLPSGIVAGSRKDQPLGRQSLPFRRLEPRTDNPASKLAVERSVQSQAHPKEWTNQQVTDRQLSKRSQQGLVGVRTLQRRALLGVEKKMQKKEIVVKAAHNWARERVANKQKFYRVSVSWYTLRYIPRYSSLTIVSRLVR